MSIVSKEYRTITQIAGPLVFVEKTEPVGYNELATVTMPDGTQKRGQVLDTSGKYVVIQVFEGTAGVERAAGVKFLGETMRMPVSRDMLGRILNGAGDPIDGGPAITPEDRLDINGAAINPWARAEPKGSSRPVSRHRRYEHPGPWPEAPIFSGCGLRTTTSRSIARQAKVRGSNEEFAVGLRRHGLHAGRRSSSCPTSRGRAR
jgi:V/A-type H+-transporting ATPase subunit B